SPHGRAGTSMRWSANAFAKQRRASFSACMRGISRATRSGRQSSRRGGRFGGKSRSRLLGQQGGREAVRGRAFSATTTIMSSHRRDGTKRETWRACRWRMIADRAKVMTVFLALTVATRYAIDEAKNRPTVVDSCWNVLESESRDFLLKISFKNFCRFAVRIAMRDQKKLCQKFNALA